MSGLTFKALVGQLIGLINLMIPVLAAAAMVLFLYGIFRYVQHGGGAKGSIFDKELMGWGIVALFVLFSMWGIVRIMCFSFFGDPKCQTSISTINTTPGTVTNPNNYFGI